MDENNHEELTEEELKEIEEGFNENDPDDGQAGDDTDGD